MNNYDPSGFVVTPQNADIYPLPRCPGPLYGSSADVGPRTDDARGFQTDAMTRFLADAFLRNSPFTYPRRAFEITAGLKPKPCTRKKPKRCSTRRKSRKVEPSWSGLKEYAGMLSLCSHPTPQTHGQPPRTWKTCEDCGLHFDFQGDWN